MRPEESREARIARLRAELREAARAGVDLVAQDRFLKLSPVERIRYCDISPGGLAYAEEQAYREDQERTARD